MEEPPARPPELVATDFADSFGRPENDCWVEGAEWLYAGASPIVAEGCSCPTMRFHTDWYKRTFVPETYRHSFAVLDAAGNLLLHLGRYGVYGEPGTLAPAPDGSVPLALARFISGTDQYLVLDDWHERLVVLRLTYQAEADVPVTMKR